MKFEEDQMLRHFEPILTLQMELQRLCLFSVRYLQNTDVDPRGIGLAPRLSFSRKPSQSDVTSVQKARVHYFYANEEIKSLPRMLSIGRSAPKIGHQDRRVFVRAVIYESDHFLRKVCT